MPESEGKEKRREEINAKRGVRDSSYRATYVTRKILGTGRASRPAPTRLLSFFFFFFFFFLSTPAARYRLSFPRFIATANRLSSCPLPPPLPFQTSLSLSLSFSFSFPDDSRAQLATYTLSPPPVCQPPVSREEESTREDYRRNGRTRTYEIAYELTDRGESAASLTEQTRGAN